MNRSRREIGRLPGPTTSASAIITLGLFALTALAAPLASAGGANKADARGDVVNLEQDEAFPADSVSDLVGITAHHRAHSVTATARFHDLRWTSAPLTVDVSINADGDYHSASVTLSPEHRHGTSGFGWEYQAGAPLTCPAMRHTVNYAQDNVRVVVPRSCFGSGLPRTVRVAVYTAYGTHRDIAGRDGRHQQNFPPAQTRTLRSN